MFKVLLTCKTFNFLYILTYTINYQQLNNNKNQIYPKKNTFV